MFLRGAHWKLYLPLIPLDFLLGSLELVFVFREGTQHNITRKKKTYRLLCSVIFGKLLQRLDHMRHQRSIQILRIALKNWLVGLVGLVGLVENYNIH